MDLFRCLHRSVLQSQPTCFSSLQFASSSATHSWEPRGPLTSGRPPCKTAMRWFSSETRHCRSTVSMRSCCQTPKTRSECQSVCRCACTCTYTIYSLRYFSNSAVNSTYMYMYVHGNNLIGDNFSYLPCVHTTHTLPSHPYPCTTHPHTLTYLHTHTYSILTSTHLHTHTHTLTVTASECRRLQMP